MRTFICQLSGHNLAVRLASKSASKFSVYKWVWDHFPGNFCQQVSQREAGNAPPKQPAIIRNRDKSIEKEQQQPAAAPAAAAFSGKAQKLFQELPEGEREAVMALFYKRSKKQPVENVEAWFVKCIEEGWYREERLELPSEPPEELSDYEKNRALAKGLKEKGLPIFIRADFLEVDLDGQRRQIFYDEAQLDFSLKLEYVKRIFVERNKIKVA